MRRILGITFSDGNNMCGSVGHGKGEIKEWIEEQLDIKTIVDVGAGSATYPQLLGDKYKYKAIEIWAPYIEMWGLEKYYDEIRIGDVRYIKFPKGDCIIFGDILEHMGKEDALEVIRRANSFYKHMVISIPLSERDEITPSKIHYGNWFEKHISAWTFEELEGLVNWDFKRAVHRGQMGIFTK